MKKTILLCSIMCTLFQGASAQTGFRKLRPDEVTFLNGVRAALYAAVPHVYKDWKVVADKEAFDANKFWCQDPEAEKCLGDCPKTLGVTDPYSLSYLAEYSMPNDQAGKLAVESMGLIKDFTDNKQLVAAQKFSAKSKMKITVFENVFPAGVSFSYCAATPMENLQLPVPATIAVIGKHSPDCPIMDGSRVTMSGDYYDRALIVLGKPVTKKTEEKTSDGLTTVTYVAGFDKSKIGKPITQNIVVEIKGDADDIKAAVKLIDWKKLSDMIAK